MPRAALIALLTLLTCSRLDAGVAPTTPDTTALDTTDAASASPPVGPLRCRSYNGYEPQGPKDLRLEVRLVYLRPGAASDATLCIEGDGRPEDNCRKFIGGETPFPKVWTIDLKTTWRLQVWATAASGGGPRNDCYIYRQPRSFLKFKDQADFEAVFWARPIEVKR